MAMVLVLVVLCVGITLTNACSCMQENTPDRFCRYNLIFRGVALAEYEEREVPLDPTDPLSEYSRDNDRVYMMRVDHAILMPENLREAKTVTMRTPAQDSLCGTRFSLDTDTVFFAEMNSDGELVTGLCDPNVLWASLSESEQEILTDNIVDYCTTKDNVTPPKA